MYMCRFSGRTCYIIFYLEIKITNNYNHGRHDQRNASKSFLFRLQKFPQETRDGLLEGSDEWDLTEILPDCLSTTNKKNTGGLTFLYSISIRKLTNIYSMICGLNMSTKTMNDNSWLKRCCRIHSAKKNESLSYCIVVIVWYEHSVKSSCLMSHILQVPP